MIFSSSSDDEKDLNEKKEFISSFDNTNVTVERRRSPKKRNTPKEEVVIPFMAEERKVQETTLSSSSSSNSKKKWGLTVPKPKKSQESEGNEGEVPLLLRNRLVRPEEFRDEAEGLQKDLNRRPEEPTMESYSKTPVSRFGEEMMKMMGWTGPSGSGSKKDQQSAIQYIPRPERLGLGASMARDVSDLKTRKPVEVSLGLEMTKDEEKQVKRASEPKRKVDLQVLASHSNYISADEALTGIKKIRLNLDVGSRVSIVSGDHAGLFGTIKSPSKDESSWLVELQINGQNVLIPKSFVKRYDQESSKSQPPFPVEHFKSPHSHSWACSGLKVKLKSKSFISGKYYNSKGIIMDVHPDHTCTIRLIDSGRVVLQNVPQSGLETCLPRSADPSRSTVKYLKRDRGEGYFLAPFRVLHFDDQKGFAIIQAEDDLETCFEAHYDDICEFV